MLWRHLPSQVMQTRVVVFVEWVIWLAAGEAKQHLRPCWRMLRAPVQLLPLKQRRKVLWAFRDSTLTRHSISLMFCGVIGQDIQSPIRDANHFVVSQLTRRIIIKIASQAQILCWEICSHKLQFDHCFNKLQRKKGKNWRRGLPEMKIT